MDITNRSVQLSSGALHYLEAGEGPALVLLHGWGASSRYWLPTLAELARERRVVAVDLPGFGASPGLAEPATIARQAAVVGELVDALGLDIVDLAGHSYGASVAAVLAGALGQRVRRLALVSFGLLADPGARQLMALMQQSAMLALHLWQPVLNITHPVRTMLLPIARGLVTLPPTPQLLGAWFLATPPTDERLLEEGVRDLIGMDLRSHLGCIASVGDPAVVAALDTVSAPMLVVGGREDRVAPPDSLRATAGIVRGAALRLIDSCGHVPMYERPAAFHAILREFLA